jgi:hypothetical protein
LPGTESKRESGLIRRGTWQGEGDGFERGSSVDVEAAARHDGLGKAFQCGRSALRVSSVEHADPDGEGQVVAGFCGPELEILDGDVSHGEASRSDEVGAGSLGLVDGGDRPVESEHVTVRAESACDFTGCGAGSAADLEDAKAGFEREGVDDRREPR